LKKGHKETNSLESINHVLILWWIYLLAKRYLIIVGK